MTLLLPITSSAQFWHALTTFPKPAKFTAIFEHEKLQDIPRPEIHDDQEHYEQQCLAAGVDTKMRLQLSYYTDLGIDLQPENFYTKNRGHTQAFSGKQAGYIAIGREDLETFAAHVFPFLQEHHYQPLRVNLTRDHTREEVIIQRLKGQQLELLLKNVTENPILDWLENIRR
ncbi:MAG TPA: hypothetical protein VJB87_04455 [Candidatus Nanoarchaeia archaeon]|nr:hypothetical protein [Candidatus Nanoarchaeia archaeon]